MKQKTTFGYGLLLMLFALLARPEKGMAQCVASFTYTITGSTVYFTSTSTGVTGNTTYVWDFGDSNSGIGQTIQYVYSQPNVYYVCLTVIDSACTNQFCDSVTVQPNCPPAVFSASVQGNSVYFTENVTGVSGSTTWYWWFGDGYYSTAQNPSHNYFASGVYTVCLSYYDPVGQCQDSACQPITVGLNGISESEQIQGVSTSPNPFNEQLGLSFTLQEPETVEIGWYDLPGKKVFSENTGKLNAGKHALTLSAAALPAGVYLLRIKTATTSVTRKVVKL